MDLLASDMDNVEIKYEVGSPSTSQVCGICGEDHSSRECGVLRVTNQILDKVIPSKARLTLPDTLEIINLADGSSNIYTKCFIEKGTQFGPFQAKKLFTLHPSIEFPLKIFTDGSEDLSEFFLDTSDENECNWMIFIGPAREFEEQNTMCYQEGDSLYYVTIKDVQMSQPLKVWYSPYYAAKMKKRMLQNRDYEENEMENGPADVETILRRQKNITPRDFWSCKFCGKVEKKLSVFALHLLEHYKSQMGSVCTICKESFLSKMLLRKHLKIVHASNTKKPIEIIQNIQILPPKTKDPISKEVTSVGGPLLLNDIMPDSLDNTSLLLPPTDISQFDLGSIDNQSMLLENENLNLNMDNILTDNVKGLDHFDFDINETEPEKLVCDICLKSFIKLKSLTMHIEKHTGKFLCRSCNKVFGRKESLLHHSCNAYYKEKCPLCDSIFFQKKYLTRHMNVVHNKKLACEMCKKVFATRIRLENHYCPCVPLDKTEKFPCTICPKIFFKKYSLKQHIARHKKAPERKSQYICAVCNKILNSTSSYSRHAKMHEGHSLKCDMCDKQFKRTDTLSVHKRQKHSSEKKEETCTVCDKKLKSLKLLNIHMEIHKKDKPYKCDMCEASFRQRSNLTKHSHKHKLFNDKQLEDIFREEGIVLYKCPQCDKQMKLKSSLQRHMKMQHPDDELPWNVKPKLWKLTEKLLDEFEMKTENINSEEELDLKQTIEDMNFSTDEVNCNDINIEIDKMLNSDNIETFLTDSTDGIVESLINIAAKDELSLIGERYVSKEVCLSMPDLSEND